MNIDEYITKASMLINLIQHEELRHIVRNAFNDNSRLWATAPAAKGVHHAFVGGNLKHAVDTATKARAIAQLVPGCRVDLCVAGALLHDVGKLFTYELDGVAVDMTDEGSLMEHITMGIALLERYRTEANNDLIRLLQHIIASHHEKLEYGSPVIPRFIEAWIVAYADNLDAKLQTIIEANEKANPNSKLTEKVWVMDNRQMFTRHYLDTILGDEDEMEVM